MFSKSLRLPLFGLLAMAALTLAALYFFSSDEDAGTDAVAQSNQDNTDESSNLDEPAYFANKGGNVIETNADGNAKDAVISTSDIVEPLKTTVVKEVPIESTKGQVVEYTIKSGDAISRIARKFGCSEEDIYRLNARVSKSTASKIQVGWKIQVIDNNGIGGVVVGGPAKAEVVEVKNEQPAVAPSEGPINTDVRETPVLPEAPKIVTSQIHIFKSGETAFTLSRKYYGTISYWKVIKNANPHWDIIDSPSGVELVIPSLNLEKGEVVSNSTDKGLIPSRR